MFFHFVKYKLDTIKLKTKLFAKHPEKTREKVAETAKIPKTAPKTQQNFLKQHPKPSKTSGKDLAVMCTQCQGHLVFYFPNIWTLSFMEFQDSYNEFCRIKKFVQ